MVKTVAKRRKVKSRPKNGVSRDKAAMGSAAVVVGVILKL